MQEKNRRNLVASSLIVLTVGVVIFCLLRLQHDGRFVSSKEAPGPSQPLPLAPSGEIAEAPPDTASSVASTLAMANMAASDAKVQEQGDRAKATPKSGSGNESSNESGNESGNESAGNSKVDFGKLSRRVLDSLPTTVALKKLSAEEIHETPELVQQAALAMGQIADALDQHPELAKEGLSFYKTCFRREDLLLQIRALCLADHRNLRAAQNLPEDAAESAVPKTVLELAGRVISK